jgi:hypothetical protein
MHQPSAQQAISADAPSIVVGDDPIFPPVVLSYAKLSRQLLTSQKERFMAVAYQLVSIDPWRPAINQTITHLPLLVGDCPSADIQVETRWAEGQWCEIVDGSPRPRAFLHAPDESGQPVYQQLDFADLIDEMEFNIGIRSFRISAHASPQSAAEERAIAAS